MRRILAASVLLLSATIGRADQFVGRCYAVRPALPGSVVLMEFSTGRSAIYELQLTPAQFAQLKFEPAEGAVPTLDRTTRYWIVVGTVSGKTLAVTSLKPD